VGLLQGLAVLPGVSRSGTTVSALLLRGYDGPDAIRLSFVLSIPAAVGAGAIAYAETGVPDLSTGALALALLTSAAVGYASVDALTRLARRLAFSRICVGFGVLAVAGGALAMV
jgi:undecaprenyl-diphosphatase